MLFIIPGKSNTNEDLVQFSNRYLEQSVARQLLRMSELNDDWWWWWFGYQIGQKTVLCWWVGMNLGDFGEKRASLVNKGLVWWIRMRGANPTRGASSCKCSICQAHFCLVLIERIQMAHNFKAQKYKQYCQGHFMSAYSSETKIQCVEGWDLVTGQDQDRLTFNFEQKGPQVYMFWNKGLNTKKSGGFLSNVPERWGSN